MDRNSAAIRAAPAGPALALCLTSTLFVGACIVKQPNDFPVMRLTDPASGNPQPAR
jgi:hypothetical protein